MFRTVPLSIIRSFSPYTRQWYMLYRFADSLRAGSGRSTCFGRRNCPKHVEFYSENKFEKLVHLAGFIIRFYHDARSPERPPPQKKKLRVSWKIRTVIQKLHLRLRGHRKWKTSVILLSDKHNYILVDSAYLVFSRYCCMFRLSTSALIREVIGSQKEIKKGQDSPYKQRV